MNARRSVTVETAVKSRNINLVRMVDIAKKRTIDPMYVHKKQFHAEKCFLLVQDFNVFFAQSGGTTFTTSDLIGTPFYHVGILEKNVSSMHAQIRSQNGSLRTAEAANAISSSHSVLFSKSDTDIFKNPSFRYLFINECDIFCTSKQMTNTQSQKICKCLINRPYLHLFTFQ